MAGFLVSPSCDTQIRKRNDLYKKRKESPKFRDILRERCYCRMKARRGALLEQFRQMGSTKEIHNALSTILHEEVNVLKESDIEIMEAENTEETGSNYEELEEDKWIIREYEKVLEEEELMFSEEWENQVICPLCERSVLKMLPDSTTVCIKCSSKYPPVPSLRSMQESLNACIKDHEENCTDLSQFALISDNLMNGLFLICQTCGYFVQTI